MAEQGKLPWQAIEERTRIRSSLSLWFMALISSISDQGVTEKTRINHEAASAATLQPKKKIDITTKVTKSTKLIDLRGLFPESFVTFVCFVVS
jgi:hypothetical protein